MGPARLAVTAASVGLFATAGAGRAQRAFNGRVTYKVTRNEAESRSPAWVVVSEKGSRVRAEVRDGHAADSVVTLIDYATGGVTVVYPNQRRYVSGGWRDRPTPAVTVLPAGREATIAGNRCQVFTFFVTGDSVGGTSRGEACVATALGHFTAMEGGWDLGGGLGGPLLAGFLRTFKDGGVPLRVSLRGRSWVAVLVEPGTLGDDLFLVPAGYTEHPAQ